MRALCDSNGCHGSGLHRPMVNTARTLVVPSLDTLRIVKSERSLEITFMLAAERLQII